MRLIDAEKVGCGMAETWQRVIVGLEVDKTPTIDPEALPIVRQLREELSRVTAERDAAVKDLYTIRACDTCALQYTDKCLLEDCMDPCYSFGSGDVPYKWRGPQKEANQ